MGTWFDVKNVLCVRLDGLGDLLMTEPALRAVKCAPQNPRVTLLTSSSGAQAAALMPEIDETIVYAAPWMKPPISDRASDDLALIGRLAKRRFDAAIIFTCFSQNPLPAALLCYLAGIPQRLAHCRENPYHLLTTWIPDPEPAEGIRHEVQRQLDLVGRVGFSPNDERMRIMIGEEARRRTGERLASLRIAPEEPIIVVHPGATAASRRYPPELFADAVEQIHEQTHGRIFLTGDAAERPLIDEIRARVSAPVISLAGQLDLPDLAALINRADLLLVNNTGPAHIAAAVGTPVVDLYALTNPQHTPWRVPSRVLSYDVPCRNCFKSVCPEGHNNCLRKIPPQEVVQAALELLKRSKTCTH